MDCMKVILVSNEDLGYSCVLIWCEKCTRCKFSCSNISFHYHYYASNATIDVRQQVAIPKHQLLPISATNQVCTEFGIHPDLPAIKALYDDEDMLFFANTGVLSQPVNKENYYVLTNMQLFAHNHMVRETNRIDPYDISSGTGVLGRMTDVMSRAGHEIGSFSVDGLSVALVGKPGVTKAPVIVGRRGVPSVYLDETSSVLSKLHNESETESGIFAETWSSSMMEAIETNDLLRAELDGMESYVEFPNTPLGNSLETVSKVRINHFVSFLCSNVSFYSLKSDTVLIEPILSHDSSMKLIVTRNKHGVDTDTFFIQRHGKLC